jgi:ribonuclease-3
VRRREEFERCLDGVQQALQYSFKEPEFLRQALTHTSFAHENGCPTSNEPLEFLGDAVLGMLVAERIVRLRSELDEGAMTRLRSLLVNTRSLAREAELMSLGSCLLLGKGEERSGGRTKMSLLADARTVVNRLFTTRIKASGTRKNTNTDAKTELQEWVQARAWPLPEYRVVESRGPDHSREFVVEVWIRGECFGVGHGSAKKRAEQEAAAAALAHLCQEHSG